MQFDASNPYHRHMLHYESDNQLSVPELIAYGSVNAQTAAILWFLLDRRASFMISGPTDPTPGVGKTTTLNSLLPFYPAQTGMVYTLGMYEEFDFIGETDPATTTVLANEVSNHLRIYMWGRKARRFLDLPERGYAIATTCHADTIDDVLQMLTNDLSLGTKTIQNLRVIVNIGLYGMGWPQKRRWLTTHFVVPATSAIAVEDASATESPLVLKQITRWDAATDTFTSPDADAVQALATWAGITPEAFTKDIAARTACLEQMAADELDYDVAVAKIQAFKV